MNDTFQKHIEKYLQKLEELKALKKKVREIETDYPMELEELLLALKDLQSQVKEQKSAFEKSLLENHLEYGEMREMIQTIKEEIAESKEALTQELVRMNANGESIDQTLMIDGYPQRVQTVPEVTLFLNGKPLK